MSIFSSPLRYPGGKYKIVNYLKQLITQNNLLDGTYIEPFAGGAAVAFELLFSEYVNEIIINDIDQNIYSFWFAILNDPEAFIEEIIHTPVNIEIWKKMKQKVNKEDVSMFERGFATFYLNRCNISGIIGGGPIGGIAQSGKWKIDARFNKKTLIKRIQKIQNFRNRIQLYNLDALKFLHIIQQKVRSRRAFIYLDPPYYHKGQELYLNFYKSEDHQELATYINNDLNKHWLLSYDNCQEIKELYQDRRSLEFSLNYSANTHVKGKEIMFFSNSISIPTTLPAY